MCYRAVAQLGIGASWYEREQGLGVHVVPVKERFERLEETLQICLQMWSDNNGPYQGTHYQTGGDIVRARAVEPTTPAHPHRGRG